MIREEQKSMDALQSGATSEVAESASVSTGGFRREGLAATGGVVGALAATGCCILPMVLFSLGVGGVWIGRLASLAPYQPYFIGFAALSIGYGFRQVYRRPKAACAEDAACAQPLPKRLVKTALWSATVLVLAAIIYPFVIPYIL
jgi:mercuric ion transport protein